MAQEPYDDDRSWDERIQELYDFLINGDLPEGVSVGSWRKMSPRAAMSLIWFLQEITHVLPDDFEQCAKCKSLINTYSEGTYIEKTGRHYCDDCAPACRA